MANFWDALSALGAIAAAVIAFCTYLIARRGIKLAQDTLREAEQARRVTLSIMLSERFSSDEMHKALAYLGRRRNQYEGDIQTMCDAYVIEAEEARQLETVSAWSINRRKVSKFFIAACAQIEMGLLDPDVFASQIGRASIELYIQVMASLDEVQAARVQGRDDYFDPRVRDYFSRFLIQHFSHE